MHTPGLFVMPVENSMVQGLTIVEDIDFFLVIRAGRHNGRMHGVAGVLGLNLSDDLSGIITLEGDSLAYDHTSSYRT